MAFRSLSAQSVCYWQDRVGLSIGEAMATSLLVRQLEELKVRYPSREAEDPS